MSSYTKSISKYSFQFQGVNFRKKGGLIRGLEGKAMENGQRYLTWGREHCSDCGAVTEDGVESFKRAEAMG